MAACCALSAYIIYRLISFHSSLSFPTSATPEVHNARSSQPATTSHSLIALQGLTCSSCVDDVENACLLVPGVSAAHVSLQSLTARIVYDPELVNPKILASEIEQIGFEAVPQVEDEEEWISQWLTAARHKDETVGEWTRAFTLSAALSGLVFIVEAVGDRRLSPVSLFLIRLILVIPSIRLSAAIHKEAWRATMRGRPNASLLSSCGLIATLVAGLYGDLDAMTQNNNSASMQFCMTSACLLMTVIIGGRVTKCHFSQRSSQYPAALASALPQSANLMRNAGCMDEHSVSVPIDMLRRGDVIRVDPQENFPVDGNVVKGHTSVRETVINGELTPKSIGPGASIYAGSSNGLGVVFIEVCAVKSGTWLGQTLKAMAQSGEAKSNMSHFADRLLGRFSVIVILISTVAGVYHWSQGASIQMVLTRIATVLLCACPCTLDMGMSACLMSAVSVASKAGILLNPGFHIDNSANARAIVFDKTGTLTTGQLQIQGSYLENDWADGAQCELFWNLVGVLSRPSEHPVSRLLCAQLQREYKEDFGDIELLSHKECPGLGMTGIVSHEGAKFNVIVGNQRLLQMNNIYITTELPDRPKSSLPVGNVYIAIDNALAGRIAYTDTIAKGASHLIHTLHSRGFSTFIMTGDTKAPATAVAECIGIPASNVYSSMLPHEKAEQVQRLEGQYGHTVMVGDNANDIPALLAATLGFLLFHRPPSRNNILSQLQSEADAILLPNTENGPEIHDMERVSYALGLIRATSRRMHQILWFSLIYNGVALCLASGLISGVIPEGKQSWPSLEPSSASLAMSVNSTLTLWFSLQLQK